MSIYNAEIIKENSSEYLILYLTFSVEPAGYSVPLISVGITSLPSESVYQVFLHQSAYLETSNPSDSNAV